MAIHLATQSKLILDDLGAALRSIYDIDTTVINPVLEELIEQLKQIPCCLPRLVELDMTNERVCRMLNKECNLTVH